MKDTDTDWAMLGEGEPFFGVLSEPRFLRANITPEALEDFWATGRNEMNGYRQLIQTHFGAFPDASALDFGCGVGRLTRAMGEMCQKATGLDISPGMLAEARRHAPSNVSYVSELGDETFDWLNSIIVFQHIPPKRGYRLLDDLLARVNPGGRSACTSPFSRMKASCRTCGRPSVAASGTENASPRWTMWWATPAAWKCMTTTCPASSR